MSLTRPPLRMRRYSGCTFTELTATSWPPASAEADPARTRISAGTTQCAAVTTLTGETTEPVQSVRSVRTETT